MGIFYPLRNNGLEPICQVNTMIDAHLHLCDDSLYASSFDLIQEAQLLGVSEMLCVVTNNTELLRAYQLKEKVGDLLKIAAATTPHDANSEVDPFFEEVKQGCFEKKIQAIGETGLEYFHQGLDHEKQKKFLKSYLDLAITSKLPLVFHCRDAFSPLFDILSPHKGKLKGMIHCFTGNLEEALESIDLGFFISISGIVTFKKSESLQEVVRQLPLDKILIETDSPYLAPLSKRGKINRPSYVKETYEKVALLKQIPIELVEKQVQDNFKKMFL